MRTWKKWTAGISLLAGVAGTGVAVRRGHLPLPILAVVIAVIVAVAVGLVALAVHLGRWLWASDERTDRFNATVMAFKAKPGMADRVPKMRRSQPTVEAEPGSPVVALATPAALDASPPPESHPRPPRTEGAPLLRNGRSSRGGYRSPSGEGSH